MQRALNLKNFQTFMRQVKGAQVGEITVAKAPGPKGTHLKYTARDPRTRRVFNGEWVLADGAQESEFFLMAEKQFAVRRQDDEAQP